MAARRLHEVPLPAQLAGLLVVDEEDLHLLEGLPQLRRLAVDPEVHRVAGHDPRPLDLLEDLPLQHGIDVAEEDELRVAVAGGDLRLEELEDVEVGADRVAGVEVERVLALPVEGLPVHPLEALEVDGPAAERGELLLPEVVADDPDEVDRTEEGSGHREEGRAPAEHPLGPAEGRLDRVVGDAPDDEDGHCLPRYFMYRPTIGSSSRRTASGTSSGGVTSACAQGARALAVAGDRAGDGRPRAGALRAVSAFFPRTREDLLGGHRVVVRVPAVVVRDHGERRVADLGLAGELRLLEVGHADEVDAPRPVELRLGERRELRPLHADVGPARRGAVAPASAQASAITLDRFAAEGVRRTPRGPRALGRRTSTALAGCGR